VITPPSEAVQLKQGIWTEHDTALGTVEYTEEQADALSNPEKYTDEELEAILSSIESIEEPPAVGMMVEGDKAYFFTYSAEGADDLVEGKISYNKDAGTGVIAFPAIKDSPVSGQTVNFTMVSEETMEFEFTYEGKKVTGSCAWLCDNLDNWSSDITDADWLELMAYYEGIKAKGPDASIDWSDSSVEGLDEPLVWDDEVASTRANTRIAIFSAITTGLKIFGSLFEEDPNEQINAKLDAVLGKLDNVLANQQVMMAKLDEINGRLIEIAQRMEKTEIVNMFNNRNEKFYNKLKVQNRKYFDSAYKLYKEDKNAPKLGQYAKAWVGKDEQFANLTWEYIEYLTTVEHTGYGKGLDRIYDGLVFDKYPWEHIGIGDRKSYRAYDLTMIAKCLFMISLYSAHGGLNDVEKEGLYNSYKGYKPQLKAFSEFKISDPDKFRVCQIKGAHFIMHKEIQTYNYVGNNNECPHPNIYGANGIYRPKWHEAGSIKIENPEELKSKLIHTSEMDAVSKFYDPDTGRMSWVDMLVKGKDNAGGAVISNKQIGNDPSLLLYNPGGRNGAAIVEHRDELALVFYSITAYGGAAEWLAIGPVDNNRWVRVDPERRYYAAIVEKHY
jgi:hypothetical protein